jgi:CBS domain containing-hemolysin-like protein
MTLAILIFSEVIPKNLGVAYRTVLQKHAAYPLYWMRRVLRPLTHLCNLVVRAIIRRKPDQGASDREIVLLAEKGARGGDCAPSRPRPPTWSC